MDLTGKIAIVTGGGSGTGLAVAERFISAGATVVIAEIDALAGAMAADALDGKGRVYFIDVDVASEPSVKAAAERVMTAYGRIDFLVNSASLDRRRPVTDLPLEDWHRVMGVNLTGAYLFAKHCAAELAANEGAIVNIASSRLFAGEPDGEAYAASKVGLIGLTQSLAVSLAPRVRVNCISPHRVGASVVSGEAKVAGLTIKASEIAETVLRLCADRAGVASGSNITLEAA